MNDRNHIQSRRAGRIMSGLPLCIICSPLSHAFVPVENALCSRSAHSTSLVSLSHKSTSGQQGWRHYPLLTHLTGRDTPSSHTLQEETPLSHTPYRKRHPFLTHDRKSYGQQRQPPVFGKGGSKVMGGRQWVMMIGACDVLLSVH
jgi:hypothetical protein